MGVLIGAGLLAVAWAVFYFFVLDKKPQQLEPEIQITNKTPENIFMDIADLSAIHFEVKFGRSESAQTYDLTVPVKDLKKQVKKTAGEEIKKLLSIDEIDFSSLITT